MAAPDPAELATVLESLAGIDPHDPTVDLRQTIKPTVRLSATAGTPEGSAVDDRPGTSAGVQPPRAEGYRLLDEIWRWLGLPPAQHDLAGLDVRPTESDSHYRFKYPHRVHAGVTPPEEHVVPERIARSIRKQFRWYYQNFYPGLLES
jgi:hypothetical protein